MASKSPNSKRSAKPRKHKMLPSSVAKHLSEKTAKQVKYVVGVAEGKSKHQAALDAGYRHSVARNTRVIESAGVRMAFQELVRLRVSGEKIAARLAEGLDAMETEFAKFEGSITDNRDVVAWGERRQYLELAAKMGGYYVEKQELSVNDLRKSLEDRSTEELLYFDQHGCWPEDAAPGGAGA